MSAPLWERHEPQHPQRNMQGSLGRHAADLPGVLKSVLHLQMTSFGEFFEIMAAVDRSWWCSNS